MEKRKENKTSLTMTKMVEADKFIEILERVKETLNNIEDTSKIDTNDIYDLMLIRKKINRELKNKVNDKEIYESYTSILKEIDLALSVIDIEKIKDNEIKQNEATKNQYKKLRNYEHEKQIWEYTVGVIINRLMTTCIAIIFFVSCIFGLLRAIGIISESTVDTVGNLTATVLITILGMYLVGFVLSFALSKRMNYERASEYNKMNKAKFIYNNMHALFLDNNIHGKKLSIKNKNINSQLLSFEKRFYYAETFEDELKICVDVEDFYENNKKSFGNKIVKLIET